MVDAAAEQLREMLPADARSWWWPTTAWSTPRADPRLDVDDHPELLDGVRLLGGEARFRHLYCRGGAVDDVVAAWSVLGDRAEVLTRDDALAAGWFGPVAPAVRPRIGDVWSPSRGDFAVMSSRSVPATRRRLGRPARVADVGGDAGPVVPCRGRTLGCPVAELHFFTGTMDCGKSTLALQMDHNHAARGRVGRIFTSHDRAGEAMLSCRLGLPAPTPSRSTADLDFWTYVVDALTARRAGSTTWSATRRSSTPPRRSTSWPGSSTSCRSTSSRSASSPTSAPRCSRARRLVELADRINVLQVEALCWCGERATHNARTETARWSPRARSSSSATSSSATSARAGGRLRGAVPRTTGAG